MQIYKKRDLGQIISDSLQFFKQNGKNYFKNYLAINGVILLVMILLIVVGFGDIIGQLYNSNMGNSEAYFEQYFQENPGILIVTSSLIFIIYFILMIVNLAFPVVYLNLHAKTGRNDFIVSEIIEGIKEKIGKMFIFLVFSIFILMPVALIVLGVNILLCFLIIGFVLFMITIPLLMNISNFTFYDYMLTDKGIFESFSYAINMQFSNKSWKYIFSTLIMYTLITVITSIFTTIPMFIVNILSVSTGEDNQTVFAIIVLVLYVISILVSLLSSNIYYIAFGLMYFDNRKDLHHKEQLKEIDTIGSL